MNNTVDRKQCTIYWHVDDLKISHVTSNVLDGELSQLTSKYGKLSELSFIRGRVHDYLGMRLDYGTKVKVRITLPKHTESILEAVAEYMGSIDETKEANHLFTVRKYGDTLMGMQADLFQTLVAKILFVSCRSRPDLRTELAFLTMQV